MNNKITLFFLLFISTKVICPPTRDQAATTIQSMFRGRQARKEATLRREAVATLQSASKKWLTRRQLAPQKKVSTPKALDDAQPTQDDAQITPNETPKKDPWLSFKTKRRLKNTALVGLGGGLGAAGMLAVDPLKNIFSNSPTPTDPIPVDPTPTDIDPIPEQ
jgi:hypothetical protein